MFSNQKSKFGQILEGLAIEKYIQNHRSRFSLILGKEEYADILKSETEVPNRTVPGSSQPGIGLLRPIPNPNRTDLVMATANPFVEHSISHNIGIYVWGFYQGPMLFFNFADHKICVLTQNTVEIKLN
jgi:hypothetical protein